MTPSPDSKWIDAVAAGAYLGVSVDTVYSLAKSGELRCARVTGRRAIRTTTALLDEYLERQLPPLKQRDANAVGSASASVLGTGTGTANGGHDAAKDNSEDNTNPGRARPSVREQPLSSHSAPVPPVPAGGGATRAA